jgi:hypothetical protein
VFGHQGQNGNNYSTEEGFVKPYCGSITIHTNDVVQQGALSIQGDYYWLILAIWDDARIRELADTAVSAFLPASPLDATGAGCGNQATAAGRCTVTPNRSD